MRGKIEKAHWNLLLQTPLEEIPPPELIIFVLVFSEQVYSTEIFCYMNDCVKSIISIFLLNDSQILGSNVMNN